MIAADWCRTMARYNAWQNLSLYDAADTLDDAARRADRGAFFGSIHGTLSHLLWGDSIWLHRFTGSPAPSVARIPDSADWVADWHDLRQRRTDLDARIIAWTDAMTDADLDGDLSWRSVVLGRDLCRSRRLLAMHMFNHQTHHRGQAHAMLTAAGARPADTDLILMPSLG
ncbi:MAG: DinB family protein [Rhodobacteraceae bacterium]|nr:DinB family protein [Paracoccaceae bacterium]